MTVILVRNFIDKKHASKMADQLDHKFFLDGLKPNFEPENSYDSYGIFNNELDEWVPRLEQILDKKLYPTFSYGRLYLETAQLRPHKDRGACEYVITVCLSNEEEPWPFFVEADNTVHKTLLEEGDALIYKGIEYTHWRDKLQSGSVYQAMLCYVDQNGKYTSRRNDSGLRTRS